MLLLKEKNENAWVNIVVSNDLVSLVHQANDDLDEEDHYWVSVSAEHVQLYSKESGKLVAVISPIEELIPKPSIVDTILDMVCPPPLTLHQIFDKYKDQTMKVFKEELSRRGYTITPEFDENGIWEEMLCLMSDDSFAEDVILQIENSIGIEACGIGFPIK